MADHRCPRCKSRKANITHSSKVLDMGGADKVIRYCKCGSCGKTFRAVLTVSIQGGPK